MAVGEDVAAHAVDLRVVGGDRPIELDAQDLALVARPVFRSHLGRGRQILGVVGVAPVAAEVAPLIADRKIQPAIGPDDQTAPEMIVVGGKSGDHVRRTAQGAPTLIELITADRHLPHQLGPWSVVVGEGDVDVVVAVATKQIRMEGHAEQPVLPDALVYLGNRGERRPRAVHRVDADDAPATPLGDPQLLIGSPREFPRAFQSSGDHAHRERLGRVRHNRRILRGRPHADGGQNRRNCCRQPAHGGLIIPEVTRIKHEICRSRFSVLASRFAFPPPPRLRRDLAEALRAKAGNFGVRVRGWGFRIRVRCSRGG
jgi:hypothetical protein